MLMPSMKVKEIDGSYELDIDLPEYKKDNVSTHLENVPFLFWKNERKPLILLASINVTLL